MSINIKPHAGDDIATIQKIGDGFRIRFTEAWYRYFDSIDREINVSITQNISNNTITIANSAVATVAAETDELKRDTEALRSMIAQLMAGQYVEQKDFSGQIAQLMSGQYVEQTDFSRQIAQLMSNFRPEIDTSQQFARLGHGHSPEEVGAYDRRVIARATVANYTLAPSDHMKFVELSADVDVTIEDDATLNLTLPDGEVFQHQIHTGASAGSQIILPDLSTVSLSAATIYTIRKSIAAADTWLITSNGVT